MSRQRWFHLGSLGLLLLGFLLNARGLWAGQSSQTPKPPSDQVYKIRIEGAVPGPVRRATLHFPDIPLTRPVPGSPKVFETTVRSPQPPQRFQISLQLANGAETTARGSLHQSGDFWIGHFENYKKPVQGGLGLGSQATRWVKDPQWAYPASSGKKTVAGTPILKTELLRTLPPRRVQPIAEKGHNHTHVDHPPEGHHHGK